MALPSIPDGVTEITFPAVTVAVVLPVVVKLATPRLVMAQVPSTTAAVSSFAVHVIVADGLVLQLSAVVPAVVPDQLAGIVPL